jgi:hypothetical protein
MADEIETQGAEVVETPDTETTDTPSSSTEETIDYAALAQAEKERADAAEALIIKNKKISQRHTDDAVPEEEKPITRKDLEAALASFKPTGTDPDENRFAEAQRKVKELEVKNAEIARALKAKGGVVTAAPGTHRDPMAASEPKLADADAYAYKQSGFSWDGKDRVFKKALPGKKFLNKDPKTGRTWIT